MKTFQLVAKTIFGLEQVLAAELKKIGAQNVRTFNRAVYFTGDLATMYRANFYLRTAISILKPIHEFQARDENEFYDGIKAIDWGLYLNIKDTFSISSVVNSNFFSHSQFLSLKAKDAIVDQFREKYKKRPSVDIEDPNLRINVYVNQHEVTVSLDSSGEPLFKRGYRSQADKAPLNEVLAAGMVLLSGWDAKTNFIDPMCGSGTLPIEAALIAYNIPPGIFRKEFGFEKWKDFDPDLWEEIYNESSEERFDKKIFGSDISEKAVRISEKNAKNAFLGNKVCFSMAAFEDYTPPPGLGIVMMNPPYGERLKVANLIQLYKNIGDTLKQKYSGYEAWILGYNVDALKSIGLHPSKKISLHNGPLECKFFSFSIYEGTKKNKKF